MNFAPGQISLGDIVGGELESGVIPFDRIVTQEQSYHSTNVLVLPAGVPTDILWNPTFTLLAADRLWFQLAVTHSGAPANGRLSMSLYQKSGTASVYFYDTAGGALAAYPHVKTGIADQLHINIVGKCAVAGTFELGVTLISSAGGQVNGGLVQGIIWHLRGT